MNTSGSTTINPAGSPRFRLNEKTPDGDRGAYARFEDLTGKLVQVPKPEADEQRERA